MVGEVSVRNQWLSICSNASTDDPNDAKRAYDLINELDGYHPVSLVRHPSLGMPSSP